VQIIAAEGGFREPIIVLETDNVAAGTQRCIRMHSLKRDWTNPRIWTAHSRIYSCERLSKQLTPQERHNNMIYPLIPQRRKIIPPYVVGFLPFRNSRSAEIPLKVVVFFSFFFFLEKRKVVFKAASFFQRFSLLFIFIGLIIEYNRYYTCLQIRRFQDNRLYPPSHSWISSFSSSPFLLAITVPRRLITSGIISGDFERSCA